MARQHFTRQEALQYLAGRTDLTWKKPLSEMETPYLKRQASLYKRAEQAGKEAPKRKEIRGHGQPRIKYREESAIAASSYEVGNKRYPARPDEMLPLLANTGTSKYVYLIVYGIPINYSGWPVDKKGNYQADYRTFRALRSNVAIAAEQAAAKGGTLQEQMINFAQLSPSENAKEWSKVYAIAMREAPENPYGKTARRRKG